MSLPLGPSAGASRKSPVTSITLRSIHSAVRQVVKRQPRKSTASSTQYFHHPLQHQASIRLLELQPGEPGSPLRCRITEVQSWKAVKYEALSYAWGEPILTDTIEEVASNTKVRITSNLYTALQGIRPRYGASRQLWIDAICINQMDLKEKGHQVAAMGNIFANAWRVIVWLGIDNADAATLVNCLEGWFREPLRFRYNRVPYDSLRRLRFFEQTWWHRVWVMQEFLLAQEVLFLVFDGFIPFNLLYDVVEKITSLPRYTFDNTIYQSARAMFQLFEYRRVYMGRIGQKPLQDSPAIRQVEIMSLASCVTELSLDRDCREDRDRIYGLLAFAWVDLGIVPDYEIPLYAVYNQFASRSLGAGDLHLLHFSGERPGDQSELRSFAPRHLTKEDSKDVPYSLNFPQLGFCAATELNVNVRVLSDDSVSILGVKIDSVYRVRESLEYMQPESITRWLAHSRKPPTYPDHAYLLPEPYNFKPGTPWAEALLNWIDRNKDDDAPRHLSPYIFRRRVFQTSQGYLGIGPYWMEKHDQVVMFAGGKTPFIIRKIKTGSHRTKDAWLHMGDCFLLGWMYGGYYGASVRNFSHPRSDGSETVLRDSEVGSLVEEWFTMV